MWYGITFLVGSITGVILVGIIILMGLIGFADEVARRR